MLYLATHSDGCFLDADPAERCVPVRLDPKSEVAIRGLLALESSKTAEALGTLTAWALREGAVNGRKLLPSQVAP
jgi:hypothetical protein